jgi:hypothetical protein
MNLKGISFFRNKSKTTKYRDKISEKMGQHKSDKNNRVIQLTDVLCVLLRYTGDSCGWPIRNQINITWINSTP